MNKSLAVFPAHVGNRARNDNVNTHTGTNSKMILAVVKVLQMHFLSLEEVFRQSYSHWI